MTADLPASPKPATAGSAASLKQQLEDALQAADVISSLYVADEAALRLTLYRSKRPFDDTVEAATEWLRHAGIDATASLDEETHQVVLTLPTDDAVRTLITTLLQPWITAHTAAQQLNDALADHGLDSTIDVGKQYLHLHLADEELGSAATLARLLGAPDIASELRLHRRRNIRRMAKRIQLLITGVVGSSVVAEVEPACDHEVDRLTVKFTLEQARQLARRLLRTEVSDPSVRLQRMLDAAVGFSAAVTRQPPDSSGSDRLTLAISPEQGRLLIRRLDPEQPIAPDHELPTRWSGAS